MESRSGSWRVCPRRWCAVSLLLGASLHASFSWTSSEDRRGFLGVLLPQQEVSLAPQVEGTLQRVHVRIGDRVSEDTVVAELDERPFLRERAEAAGRLDEARAAEAEAATRLKMAQETLGRRQALVEAGVVSTEQVREAEQERDLSQAVLDRARARVRQQLASIQQLDARQAHTKVLAPIAGRVAERRADPGMSVGPDTPVVRLISEATLWARFAVPVAQTRDLGIGDAVQVWAPDAGLTMTGRIKHVGAAVDEASGMVFYEAVVDQPPSWEGPPLAGQAVRVLPAAGEP